MILTCDQMRRSEERLFASGAGAEPLMERAGRGLAEVVRQFFPEPGRVHLFCGRGHNGGDALVAGRYLVQWGWRSELTFSADPEDLSPLTARKWEAYREVESGAKAVGRGDRGGPLVLIDGLLGIGAEGPLRGQIAECAQEINRLRLAEGATAVAVDIPTGLDGDDGSPADDAVVADITVTMAHVKAGLLSDAAVNHVGRLAVVPLDDIVPIEGDEGAVVLEPHMLRAQLKRRSFNMHKTSAGRVGIVSGSRGFTGAALLCAQGALRAGAGLVTLYVREDVYPILAAAAAAAVPEVMVEPVTDYGSLAARRWNVLAAGPGLGVERSGELLDIVREEARPMVLDADLLTALGTAGPQDILPGCPGGRLLTPHPGEMGRLWNSHPAGRRETAESFTTDYPVTLLLKGARSVIAQAGRPTAFNSTGHPGMATGGMGDVLTGICAALIAQGFDGYTAGCLGSWLLGRGAETAITCGDRSQESTSALDVADHLGECFDDLRRGCF